MRFRPLCVDYHTRAIDRLSERNERYSRIPLPPPPKSASASRRRRQRRGGCGTADNDPPSAPSAIGGNGIGVGTARASEEATSMDCPAENRRADKRDDEDCSDGCSSFSSVGEEEELVNYDDEATVTSLLQKMYDPAVLGENSFGLRTSCSTGDELQQAAALDDLLCASISVRTVFDEGLLVDSPAGRDEPPRFANWENTLPPLDDGTNDGGHRTSQIMTVIPGALFSETMNILLFRGEVGWGGGDGGGSSGGPEIESDASWLEHLRRSIPEASPLLRHETDSLPRPLSSSDGVEDGTVRGKDCSASSTSSSSSPMPSFAPAVKALPKPSDGWKRGRRGRRRAAAVPAATSERGDSDCNSSPGGDGSHSGLALIDSLVQSGTRTMESLSPRPPFSFDAESLDDDEKDRADEEDEHDDVESREPSCLGSDEGYFSRQWFDKRKRRWNLEAALLDSKRIVENRRLQPLKDVQTNLDASGSSEASVTFDMLPLDQPIRLDPDIPLSDPPVSQERRDDSSSRIKFAHLVMAASGSSYSLSSRRVRPLKRRCVTIAQDGSLQGIGHLKDPHHNLLQSLSKCESYSPSCTLIASLFQDEPNQSLRLPEYDEDTSFAPSFIRRDPDLPTPTLENGKLVETTIVEPELPSVISSLGSELSKKVPLGRKRPRRERQPERRRRQTSSLADVIASAARVVSLRSIGQIMLPHSGVDGLLIPHRTPSTSIDALFPVPSLASMQPSRQKRTAIPTDLVATARQLMVSVDDIDRKVAANTIIVQSGGYEAGSWFTVDGDGSSPRKEHPSSGVDSNVIARKFSRRARRRSKEESAREMLLTGCKMRREFEGKCVYKGFLSDRVVPPNVYEYRYKAMIKLNRRLIRGTAHPDPTSFCLPSCLVPPSSSPMVSPETPCPSAEAVLRAFQKSQARAAIKASYQMQDQGEQTASLAPHALLLQTRRHPNLAFERRGRARGGLRAGKSKRRRSCLDSTAHESIMQLRSTSDLLCGFEEGMLHSDGRPSLLSTVDGMDRIGKESVGVRGELLHCYNKSCEVAKEDAAFFAELAVVGGGAERGPLAPLVPFSSPKQNADDNLFPSTAKLAPVDDLSNGGTPLQEVAPANITAPTNIAATDAGSITAHAEVVPKPVGSKKRRPESGKSRDTNEKKKKKKKKKKDKKKKDKKKKRKRKQASDSNAVDDELKSKSSKKQRPEKVERKGSEPELSQEPQTHTVQPLIAVPPVQVGITPVNAKPASRSIRNRNQSGDSRSRPEGMAFSSPTDMACSSQIELASKKGTEILDNDKNAVGAEECIEIQSHRETDIVMDPLLKVAIPLVDVGVTPVVTRPNKRPQLDDELQGKDEKEGSHSLAPFSSGTSQTQAVATMPGKGKESDDFAGLAESSAGTSAHFQEANLLHSSNETLPKPHVEDPPISLLVAEQFLETSSQAVAELASGQWSNSFLSEDQARPSDLHLPQASDSPARKICCVDCPLVDEAGVDIELPDQTAILAVYLSSWEGRANDAQSGSKAFTRRVVNTASTGRYDSMHVFLCVDTPLTAVISTEIAMLQNALVRQQACPCEHITFQYVSPQSLSAGIAHRVAEAGGSRSAASAETNEWIGHFAFDLQNQQNARFLLSLVPSLTVLGALHFLRAYMVDDGACPLQQLFSDAKMTKRLDYFNLLQAKGVVEVSKITAAQLSLCMSAVLRTS